MELTFFTAARTVQFGFVAKRMLTTHRYFGCGWTALAQYQGFICFPYSVPPVSVLRVGEKLGGTWLGHLTQTHQRDILWYITSCWATKTEAEEEVFWWFWFLWRNFFLGSQGSCYLEEGWTSVSLWKVKGDFLCFVFFFPLMKLSWHARFLTLFFPALLMGTRSKQSAVWVLGYWLGLTHHRRTEQMVFTEVSKWAVVFGSAYRVLVQKWCGVH